MSKLKDGLCHRCAMKSNGDGVLCQLPLHFSQTTSCSAVFELSRRASHCFCQQDRSMVAALAFRATWAKPSRSCPMEDTFGVHRSTSLEMLSLTGPARCCARVVTGSAGQQRVLQNNRLHSRQRCRHQVFSSLVSSGKKSTLSTSCGGAGDSNFQPTTPPSLQKSHR